LSVRYAKQFTDGGIISLHQHYVDSYSVEKRKEAMWIHHFVIVQLFHPKHQKVKKIHFVHDSHSLFVRHFNHNEDQEIQTYLKTRLDMRIRGWVRGFSLIECNEVTT
jgi:hypothetical protein